MNPDFHKFKLNLDAHGTSWKEWNGPMDKCVCVFTPKILSHSPKENGANEDQGVEMWGLYTCTGHKVGQKTPNYN